MLIGGGSAPAKSKLMSVVGADDVLSRDTENNFQTFSVHETSFYLPACYKYIE